MTIVIKKDMPKEEIERLLAKINNQPKMKKGLRKYYGKFPIQGDALEIQKKLRDEWD